MKRLTLALFIGFIGIGALIKSTLTLMAVAGPDSQPVITPWSEEYALAETDNGIRARFREFMQSQKRPGDPASEREMREFERELNDLGPRGGYARQDLRPRDTNIRLAPAEQRKNISALEKLYSERIIEDLEQFGYDLFGVPNDNLANQVENFLNSQGRSSDNQNTPIGAVQDDFILNSGDEIEVFFTGQRNDRGLYKVNSKGTVLIEDFPPIPAAGRTIGQVRISITAAAKNLYNTEAYVSLSSVRQIGVLVVGHVAKPGRQNLTVFHTVLDALIEAGGIQKTGSLRQIKLVRNGRSTIVDLYGLLMHGAASMDLNLRDGDRIIIPSIGPTVAIAGEVKRPGIFELLPDFDGVKHQALSNSERLSLNKMLDYAGGVLASGGNRYLHIRVTPAGREIVEDIDIQSNETLTPLFGDGDILMVSKGREKRFGTVELAGHTRKPGIYALNETQTLAALISNEDLLGADIYPLIGIIERQDQDQLTPKMISFPLRHVLRQNFDMRLQDGDVVHLFSQDQINTLHNEQDDSLSAQENNIRREVAYGSADLDWEPDPLEDNPVLKGYLKEHSVSVKGAVRKPGAYPIGQGTTLDSILAVAGGLTLEASTDNIEITSALLGEGDRAGQRSGTRRMNISFREVNPKTIVLEPGDSIRVKQNFKKLKSNSVLILGEVQSPGYYDLLPGDKMSDLLKRAGGLSQQAYPEGAIFSRASERKAEEARFRAAARDLERSVAQALQDEDDAPNMDQIVLTKELISELRNIEAVGRITVEADPAILTVEPELDMYLEDGDRLYIPKRPLTVRVRGEVLSPASLQFRKSKNAIDYVHEAGGFTFHADKSRTFVLYPDGSAQPLEVSPWNFNPAMVPPGSTIIVPRDPEPFDFVQSARDISQIFANLAIAGVFIDDIRDDN